jgi:group I intron endonuclease
MIGIYKITSPSSKVYIGQSIDIDKRFNQYKSISQTRGQKRLHYSLKKYGVENHLFETIELCDVILLNERERYWQDFYNVLKDGLNCLLTNTNDSIKVYSDSTIEKIRVGNLGKTIPASVRKQTSDTMKSKGIKPKYKMIGFDNPKSIKIISYNVLTNETFIGNLTDTSNHFKVDRELITNRLNKKTVLFRKLKNWSFEYIHS